MMQGWRPNRRGFFSGLFGVSAVAATGASAATPGKARVAYHLSDIERVNFALGNILNHIEGEGGPDNVEIVLVVNGPALSAFRTNKANPDIVRRLRTMAENGVALEACGNTMDATFATLGDLLPGFVRVDEGGVVRLARLQADGYAYIRP
jgi:intracellular sulfur oxidation DsrE/DsrF family protein